MTSGSAPPALRPLDARGELVVADADDPHLDAGRARERSDVGDRRPDAVGLVLEDPDGDALLRPLLGTGRGVVVATAAGRDPRREGKRQHGGGEQRAASGGHRAHSCRSPRGRGR